ncbi:hypothetical protein LRS73_26865 [Methylobacterium currus]|uniref:hypothetical protein n=1 Tax=Methylobacterium currus TaxID=2051553 RepID=UPI001E35FFEE|nr:hypothetical protein [Methylobacterium currus]UHC16058.1 hypothetical protein LRS73_26865 [Methylobacterium currus]
MSDLSLFLPLTKVDAEQRLVYGVATAETKDRSGEVCDYASTKPYYEKWSGGIHKATDGKSFGNLRAMHGKVAAGKVTALSFNDDAKQIEICAKVVDEAEWAKVLEGVYTGFSQGGAYVKRWKGEDGVMRYTAEPSEISLVDLPCLPSATFQVLKADGAETRRFAPAVTVAPVEPSNADIVARAEALAKAAGQEGKPGDFIAPARQALEAEAAAAALAKMGAPGAQEASTAEPGPDYAGVEQVWKAKDGTTFAKKADALAHNARAEAEAAARATTGPVLDLLADLTKQAGGGAEGEPPARDSPARPARKRRRTADTAPGGTADKAAASDLEKGLYGVSRLASLIGEVKDLQSSFAFDAAYAGAQTDVPARIRAWASQGLSLLVAIVQSEMDDLAGSADDATMALAAGRLSDDAWGALRKAVPADSPGGRALAKVGARNSRSDLEKIQGVHDHAVALGATCGAGKAAGGDALAKGAELVEVVRAELTKVTGERDALQKAVTDQIMPAIATLQKMIGDQPVPRHLVGRAVTKGAEGGPEPVTDEQALQLLARMSPDERATLLIKVAQANPQQLVPAAR